MGRSFCGTPKLCPAPRKASAALTCARDAAGVSTTCTGVLAALTAVVGSSKVAEAAVEVSEL